MSAQFWEWFRGNSEALRRIRSVDAPIYGELQRRIAALSPDVDVEIGGDPRRDDMELVLTAHGDARHFPRVDELAASAPVLKGWRILALKPPLLEEMTIEYEGLKVSTSEIWLKIAEEGDSQQPLHVSVAIARRGDSSRDAERQSAALIGIETFLGERAYALQVCIDSFVGLPQDPGGEGFVHLRDLANRLGLSRLQ